MQERGKQLSSIMLATAILLGFSGALRAEEERRTKVEDWVFSPYFRSWNVYNPEANTGKGIHVDDWHYYPYVIPSVLYDSNVLLNKTDPKSDVSYGGIFGTTLSHTTRYFDVQSGLWGLSQQYNDLTQLDHFDYGERLALSGTTRAGLTLSLRQNYADTKDVDYQIGNIAHVRKNLICAEGSRDLTKKTDIAMGYTYQNRNFEAENVYDTQQQSVYCVSGCQMTQRSDVFVRGQGGILSSDGNDGNGTLYSVLGGLRSRQSAKLIASAGLGVLGLSSEATDDTEVGFSGRAIWLATDRFTVSASTDRSIEPAANDRDNYEKITEVSMQVDWFVLKELLLTLGSTYNSYELINDEVVDKKAQRVTDSAWISRFRVSYATPIRWLRAFAQVRVADRTSTLDRGEYTKEMVSAGVTLRY
jgi:hypothetical protein